MIILSWLNTEKNESRFSGLNPDFLSWLNTEKNESRFSGLNPDFESRLNAEKNEMRFSGLNPDFLPKIQPWFVKPRLNDNLSRAMCLSQRHMLHIKPVGLEISLSLAAEEKLIVFFPFTHQENFSANTVIKTFVHHN